MPAKFPKESRATSSALPVSLSIPRLLLLIFRTLAGVLDTTLGLRPAINRNTADSCQNDSGGPLFTRLFGEGLPGVEKKITVTKQDERMEEWQSGWTQLGIVSFGNECGRSDYPGG